MAANNQYQGEQSGQSNGYQPPVPPLYEPPAVTSHPSHQAQSTQEPGTQQQYAPTPQPQHQYNNQQQNIGSQAIQGQEGPQHVWVARPMIPDAPDIPEEALHRHEESKKKYPELNLSRGEFVISALRRHPIGLFSIWFVAALIVVLSLIILIFVGINSTIFLRPFGISDGIASTALLAIPFLLLGGLALVGGLISSYVYVQNKFFLTNESVMQFIQISIFSRKEQTVSLSNIEDASYRQHGVIQHLLNYGDIRLSTQGDETTYRFSYVSNPKHQIALLNNAVEAFKMGRPVIHLDDQ